MIYIVCTFVLPLVRRGPIRTELNYKNMWQDFSKLTFYMYLYFYNRMYIFCMIYFVQLSHQKYSATVQNVHYFIEVSMLQLTIHHLIEAHI